jgi:hypothetical protein
MIFWEQIQSLLNQLAIIVVVFDDHVISTLCSAVAQLALGHQIDLILADEVLAATHWIYGCFDALGHGLGHHTLKTLF